MHIVYESIYIYMYVYMYVYVNVYVYLYIHILYINLINLKEMKGSAQSPMEIQG